jgi:serine/threonine protein kinase/sulfur carrier protein ThiS
MLATETVSHALPIGAKLEEFEILSIVGAGGFGIVYRALDRSLERRIALKEYMPSQYARRIDGISIVPSTSSDVETFELGLRSFVNEARLLAMFDHRALVKVYRFWEANGTAYMAMPLYEGLTLKQTLKGATAPPSEAWLRSMLDPLLEACATLHAAHCFHRDIAPDNIILTSGGPVLLDFGAARRVINDATRALTVILKEGYAPIEQYGGSTTLAQGPWTDIYALCGVLRCAITGHPPPPSIERLVADNMEPMSALEAGNYSENFLRAIDAGLAIKPDNRPQDVTEFRGILDSVGDASQPFTQTERSETEKTQVRPKRAADSPRILAGDRPTEVRPTPSQGSIGNADRLVADRWRPAKPTSSRVRIVLAIAVFGLFAIGVVIFELRGKSPIDGEIAVSTLAGVPGKVGSQDGPGTVARFDELHAVAVGADGTLYAGDFGPTIRKITPDGVVSTLAGAAEEFGSQDGPSTAARFGNPEGVAVAVDGTVYVSDWSKHTIRKVTPDGVVSTLAGAPGQAGSEDGPGAAARFDHPTGVAVAADGTLYVADATAIRKVTPDGVVSTWAGARGEPGSQDGPGIAARFNNLQGVAVGADGSVYAAEWDNETIRKITPSGVVSTWAGAAGKEGSRDGSGTAARFIHPSGVAVAVDGTVYVADYTTIRKITPSSH